jgi:hypothetical protein
MKIRAHFAAAVFSLGLLATVSALAGDPKIAPEERFRELELKWMDALANKNVNALEQILAREFTIIGAGSPLEDPIATRQQWLEVGLKRPFPKHAVRVLSVHELQGAAVVHCILTADYPPMPWIPEGGTLNFLVTDTWVNRDGRWQVVARHSSLPVKSGAP